MLAISLWININCLKEQSVGTKFNFMLIQMASETHKMLQQAFGDKVKPTERVSWFGTGQTSMKDIFFFCMAVCQHWKLRETWEKWRILWMKIIATAFRKTVHTVRISFIDAMSKHLNCYQIWATMVEGAFLKCLPGP